MTILPPEQLAAMSELEYNNYLFDLTPEQVEAANASLDAHYAAKEAAAFAEAERIEAIASALCNEMLELVSARCVTRLHYPLSAEIESDIKTAVSSIVYRLMKKELL